MIEQHGEAKDVVRRTLKTKIKQLTNQILVERGQSVKEKIQRHWEHLELLFSIVMSIIFERGSLETEKNVNMLSSRIHNPLCKLSGFPKGIVEKNQINNVDLSPTKSIRIPHTDKLPQYTSWVYVARNERMVDDQSVIGKYQMYHDKNKGEMVICSDNEEEIVDPEDVKHEFTEVEDKFLRMTLEEYGCTEEVLNVVKKFVKTTNSEIQIFDCPMHGINKPLVYHSENQPVWLEPEGDKKPCSDQCYLMLKDARILSKNSTQWSFQDKVITTMEEDSILPRDDEENHTVYYASLKSLVEHTSEKLTISGSSGHGECDKRVVDGQKDLINGIKLNQISISREVQANGMSSDSYWRPLEMDLYLKGVKMFGKNSCLIAITLLPGLKTCLEVARTKKCHQDHDRNEKKENLKSSIILESLLASHLDGEKLLMGKTCVISNILLVGAMEYVERNVPVLLMELAVKNIAGVQNTAVIDLEDAVAQKVNAKVDHVHVLQPTVNVTQICGDDSLGRLPRHEDAKCGNMNLLLGQKERILLAKSDVIGWGAFAKNPISKNVCLGEYTGELIPPKEAEKRGKLYDRINTSFLFNLNDQASWVIDAFRMGDKLKFANHSSKPNCYAKVMLVGGDHRVGIFARENIKAGDEIFYDYGYDLDSAPLWALPPNEAAKKDKLVVSLSRTKKKEKKSVSFQ
ncbi:Histone-lysine N-methyltransferase EZA1 [Glycine soja]